MTGRNKETLGRVLGILVGAAFWLVLTHYPYRRSHKPKLVKKSPKHVEEIADQLVEFDKKGLGLFVVKTMGEA